MKIVMFSDFSKSKNLPKKKKKNFYATVKGSLFTSLLVLKAEFIKLII